MTYPHTAGYAKNSETSKEAAESVYDREGLQFSVMAILFNNPLGLVVDDVKMVVEKIKGRTFDRSTIAARFTELKLAEMIEETQYYGKTARGKKAVIYKLTTKGRDYILNNQVQ